MDIVVRGRNVEVPDHYRQHVAEKLARVERYDNRIIRADVELLHEKNPRQSEICQRVEITCRVRGPVVRVEACAADFYKALDLAVERLRHQRLLVEHVATLAKAQAPAGNRWLSVKHAADLADLDESTIWRAVGNGQLASTNIGRSRRISEAALTTWIETSG